MVGLMTAWDKLRALWCWLLFAVCAAGLWLLDIVVGDVRAHE